MYKSCFSSEENTNNKGFQYGLERKWIIRNTRSASHDHWEATVALDINRLHDIYHDDVIVEFPQSGERISGKHSIYELRAHYPANVTFKILRVRGEGNLWITQLVITYDGGRPVNGVNIMEFRMVRLDVKRFTLLILRTT